MMQDFMSENHVVRVGGYRHVLGVDGDPWYAISGLTNRA